MFTLPNEYRGISWSLELDFTLNPLFISIEMNCDGVHHKHSGFHFIQYKKEYCGSDYKSVDEGCSEVMLVSPIKHSPLYTATFWETLLSTVVTMLLSLYISLHGFILESIASRVAPRFGSAQLKFSDVGSENTRELTNSTSPVLRRFLLLFLRPRGYFSSQQLSWKGRVCMSVQSLLNDTSAHYHYYKQFSSVQHFSCLACMVHWVPHYILRHKITWLLHEYILSEYATITMLRHTRKWCAWFTCLPWAHKGTDVPLMKESYFSL